MQGLCESYRCLWDKKLDKVAVYVHETPRLFAIATIYGFYFDWNRNWLRAVFQSSFFLRYFIMIIGRLENVFVIFLIALLFQMNHFACAFLASDIVNCFNCEFHRFQMATWQSSKIHFTAGHSHVFSIVSCVINFSWIGVIWCKITRRATASRGKKTVFKL